MLFPSTTLHGALVGWALVEPVFKATDCGGKVPHDYDGEILFRMLCEAVESHARQSNRGTVFLGTPPQIWSGHSTGNV